MLDRELYLPQAWADDRNRGQKARVPQDVGFRIKPQLAQPMFGRVLESGVAFARFTGYAVYGGDRKLRTRLEREGIPHVMPINSNEKLWVWTGNVDLLLSSDSVPSIEKRICHPGLVDGH